MTGNVFLQKHFLSHSYSPTHSQEAAWYKHTAQCCWPGSRCNVLIEGCCKLGCTYSAESGFSRFFLDKQNICGKDLNCCSSFDGLDYRSRYVTPRIQCSVECKDHFQGFLQQFIVETPHITWNGKLLMSEE